MTPARSESRIAVLLCAAVAGGCSPPPPEGGISGYPLYTSPFDYTTAFDGRIGGRVTFQGIRLDTSRKEAEEIAGALQAGTSLVTWPELEVVHAEAVSRLASLDDERVSAVDIRLEPLSTLLPRWYALRIERSSLSQLVPHELHDDGEARYARFRVGPAPELRRILFCEWHGRDDANTLIEVQFTEAVTAFRPAHEILRVRSRGREVRCEGFAAGDAPFIALDLTCPLLSRGSRTTVTLEPGEVRSRVVPALKVPGGSYTSVIDDLPEAESCRSHVLH